MDEEQATERKRKRRIWPRILAVLVFLLLLGILVLWLLRFQLATDFIDRELEQRGVQATYDVTQIGFGTQVLENLVIGDPGDPDLTARRAAVEIELGWGGPEVGLITARGVRLRGRLVDGRVTFGEVDKLLPPPSGLPFRLPDQEIDVADSAIVLDTPAGRVAMALNGRGNLADGFQGRMALRGRGLELGGCRIGDPKGSFRVSIDDLRPTFKGPLSTEAVRCSGDIALNDPVFDVAVTLAPGFDEWRGRAEAEVARLRAGPQFMADLVGTLSFTGDAQRTRGAFDIGSAQAEVAGFRASRTGISGGYVFAPGSGDVTMRGDVSARGLVIDAERLRPALAALRSMDGTPLAPVGEALAAALLRAARSGGDARAEFRLVDGPGFGGVRFQNAGFTSRSGAELRVSGGKGITWFWPSGLLQLDGNFMVGGGGLPDARFALSQPRAGGPVEGRGRVAPIAADGARLALGDIAFTAAPDGTTRFRTTAVLDGPFKGGGVEGLTLPVSGRFGPSGFVLGESCVPVSFRQLRAEGLRIGATRLTLCPTGDALVQSVPGGLSGGAVIRSLRLAGRLGQSPIAMAAGNVRLSLAGPDFNASDVALRLGAGEWVNELDIASLTGRFNAAGVTGAYQGLSGRIAGVPLVLSEGRGDWQVQGGDLTVAGHLRVADVQDPSRFYPLESEDFRLTLIDNVVRAEGWLHHPETGTRVTQYDVEHRLRAGSGRAVLEVPGLRFAAGGFQPDDLTRLTLGVVALVDGTVTGGGTIRWDENNTTSAGAFSTEGMDLAAPFGLVEDLTTTVEFTDLLGLVSAPGQVATVGVVRTGIEVFDGLIRYQLLTDNRVRVEGGRWPYAGGILTLESTVLDFSQPTTKYLTFRVTGLDAASFVQEMEFGNIAATGTFDGVVPLVIDQTGARIAGGRLEARPPGGTLSYIGELTDKDLGVYGKLAFDALKSLRYSRFVMEMNGSLDGEFFTAIQLDGIARDTEGTGITAGGITGMVARRALAELAKIPFEFNINIQGPFRALISTARSFDDPTSLIQPLLPEYLREPNVDPFAEQAEESVQDEESEEMR